MLSCRSRVAGHQRTRRHLESLPCDLAAVEFCQATERESQNTADGSPTNTDRRLQVNCVHAPYEVTGIVGRPFYSERLTCTVTASRVVIRFKQVITLALQGKGSSLEQGTIVLIHAFA